MLNCCCKYRKLNLDGCGFERLAPNFSSLHNLESLSLTESIHALTSLQDLDKLTQLTISLHGGCIASLALVCPRNLLQLEILFPSYPDSNQLQTNDDVDSLVIDTVCCNVLATILALARPAQLTHLNIMCMFIFWLGCCRYFTML